MAIIDTHSHLFFASFDDDRDQVISAAQAQGVEQIWMAGVARESWQTQASLAANDSRLRNAYGLHPYFIEQHQQSDVDALAQWLTDHDAIAVGEIGLDATCAHFDKQRSLFIEQLKLAKKLQLPVILHHRKTLDEMIPLLKQYGPEQGGIIHAFSGSEQQLQHYTALNYLIGVGGVITYSRAQKTRAAIANASLDCLLLETDSPDMPIAGYQGQRNEPKRIKQVLDALVELRTEAAAEVEQQLFQTSHQFLLRAKARNQ